MVQDEELIHQLNIAVSAEEEMIKKVKNQSKGKSPLVSQNHPNQIKHLLVKYRLQKRTPSHLTVLNQNFKNSRQQLKHLRLRLRLGMVQHPSLNKGEETDGAAEEDKEDAK